MANLALNYTFRLYAFSSIYWIIITVTVDKTYNNVIMYIQVHLNKWNVLEKFIYFSNSTQIVKLVY